jgi:hypothetical protein
MFQTEFMCPVHATVHVAGVKVNSSRGTTALSSWSMNTLTSTVPGGPPGVVARSSVEDKTETFFKKITPNSTSDVLAKFVPMIVTTVDPLPGPEVGEIVLTVGKGALVWRGVTCDSRLVDGFPMRPWGKTCSPVACASGSRSKTAAAEAEGRKVYRSNPSEAIA